MEFIWHGTASVEITASAGRILFDPFVPLKGSKTAVKLEEFDGFTDILVTHGHFDHIVSIPEIVSRNPQTKIYCTKTPLQTLSRKGVPGNNLREIEFGKQYDVGGFLITAIHGRHAVLPKADPAIVWKLLRSENRGNLPFLLKENRLCREKDETVFYQIEAEGKTVSLMGSLNLREDIVYPQNADVLVLPYNGWEDTYTHAVRVIERLRPKRVLLDHYDDAFPPMTGLIPVDVSRITREYRGRVSPMQLRKAEELL